MVSLAFNMEYISQKVTVSMPERIHQLRQASEISNCRALYECQPEHPDKNSTQG